MDATGAFKTVLEKLGYEDVNIREALPPRHVLDFARGDDEEMTDEEVAEVMPYYKVTSAQGSFGIVMGAYLLLDTKGNGFNARNLGETEAPEDLFLTTLNTVTLTLLRAKLMEANRQ